MAEPTGRPTVWQLFRTFARIGLTSFGGGLSGWLFRIFVEERRWLADEEFLNGLGIAQALPGINVANMAIWIGYRLRGPRGAIASLFGIVLPAAAVIIALGSAVANLERFPLTHPALQGAAAAAVGLSLSMGITTVRRVPRRTAPLVVLAATFLAVGVFHWPLLWVVLGLGSLSVGIEYWRLLPG